MPLNALASAAPQQKAPAYLAALGRPERIWAIGSLHGRYGGLCQLHEFLIRRVRPFERVIYLGNYLGDHSQWTGEGSALISELIAFRNAVISISGFFASDVVFLRGGMEAMARNLTRLAFQREAKNWARDSLSKGLDCVIGAYGIDAATLINACSDRISANRFANDWSKRISSISGHKPFFDNLKNAAHTEGSNPIAFIPEGLDPHMPLALQDDALTQPFPEASRFKAYAPYVRIVRGAGNAVDTKSFLLTLDDGGHLDGMIHAVCLDAQGNVMESLSF